MNITLYINRKNEEPFKQEKEKSKLINELLAGYYGGIDIKLITSFTKATPQPIPDEHSDLAQEVLNATYNTRQDAAKMGVPISNDPGFQKAEIETLSGLEKGCCLNAKPCQHWVWNGDEQVYINSLSGRKKESK